MIPACRKSALVGSPTWSHGVVRAGRPRARVVAAGVLLAAWSTFVDFERRQGVRYRKRDAADRRRRGRTATQPGRSAPGQPLSFTAAIQAHSRAEPAQPGCAVAGSGHLDRASIVAAIVLIFLLVFVLQNATTVAIYFLGPAVANSARRFRRPEPNLRRAPAGWAR